MTAIETIQAVLEGGGNLLYNYACFRILRTPLVYNIEITGDCPLDCEHCYFHREWNCGKNRDLEDEYWMKVVNENSDKPFVFTGGEPALRMSLVRKAYEVLGRKLILISNGTIKFPLAIETRIFISLDAATEELHDKIRKRPGTFKKILKNVRGDKRVILAPTLSMTNYKEIEKLVQLARELGVYGITFSLYTPEKKKHTDDPDDQLTLHGKELLETAEMLRKVLRENPKIVFLTEGMIDLFVTKGHVPNCSLKASPEKPGWVRSRNPADMDKYPCVIGGNVSCEECGCNIPINMADLKIQAWRMLTFRKNDAKNIVRVAKMFTLQKEYISPPDKTDPA